MYLTQVNLFFSIDYIARMLNRDQYNLSNLVIISDKLIPVFLCPVIHRTYPAKH